MLIRQILGLLIVAACALLLLRLLLGAAAQQRFDAAWRRGWERTRRAVLAAWRWPLARKRAARVADDAIRRARRSAPKREGKVVHGKFGGPHGPH